MTDPAVIRTDAAPAPFAGAPYSQAIVAGELVFVSGQVGLDPHTSRLVVGGIVAETQQTFANMSAILEAAGSGLDRLVKTTVFLMDMGDFAAMNETYATFVSSTPPARSTVQVAMLPAAAIVEIECVALKR